MYIDKLVNLKNYIKNEALLNAVLNFIAKGKNIEKGKHSILGESFANVLEYDSKAFETIKMEVHHKYLDIQVVISGEETVLKQDIGFGSPISEYNAEKDVQFYSAPSFDKAILYEGTFGIMYPNDLHQCIATISPEPIKKIVFKIPVDAI